MLLISWSSFFVNGVFRALSGMLDGAFCGNSEQLSSVNHLRKTLHLRCLTSFSTRLQGYAYLYFKYKRKLNFIRFAYSLLLLKEIMLFAIWYHLYNLNNVKMQVNILSDKSSPFSKIFVTYVQRKLLLSEV